jgi:hypothetical protein
MPKKPATPYARNLLLGLDRRRRAQRRRDRALRRLQRRARWRPGRGAKPLVDGSGEAHGYIVKSSDPIYDKAPRVLSYPTGRDNDEVSETGAGPVEPCKLVSRGKAAAILAGPSGSPRSPKVRPASTRCKGRSSR